MLERESLDIIWDDDVLDQILEDNEFEDEDFEFHGFDLIEYNGGRTDCYDEKLILKRKSDSKLFAISFTRGEYTNDWIYSMDEVIEVEKLVKTYI